MSKIKTGDHVVISAVVVGTFIEPGKPTVYIVDTGVGMHYCIDPEVDLCETQPDAGSDEIQHHTV
jgi:hypothetical protein